MEGLILVLMSNVCYLAVILIFLVVIARYLVVTTGYCSLPGGYCSLLVFTAHYRLLLLVPTFTTNQGFQLFDKNYTQDNVLFYIQHEES